MAKRKLKTYKLHGKSLLTAQSEVVTRNWDGSLYTRDIRDASSPAWIFGTLVDGQTGKTYRLDYEHKCAIMQHRRLALPLQPPTGEEYKHVSPERFLGTRMISGVQCIGIKGQASDYYGQIRETETWVAPALNYEVVESTMLDKQSNTVVWKIVLEDIQAGTRPDPELFRIPEEFQSCAVGPLASPASSSFLRR